MSSTSPHPNARIIGAVYVLYFLTAIFAALLSKGLVVSSDATATASNILAHKLLYPSGIAVGLIANMLYIVLTVLFYGLFEAVNRTVSLLAAFFGVRFPAQNPWRTDDAGRLGLADLCVAAARSLSVSVRSTSRLSGGILTHAMACGEGMALEPLTRIGESVKQCV
jgi:hypothetical protein